MALALLVPTAMMKVARLAVVCGAIATTAACGNETPQSRSSSPNAPTPLTAGDGGAQTPIGHGGGSDGGVSPGPGPGPNPGIGPTPQTITPVDVTSQLEQLRATHGIPSLAGAMYKDGQLVAYGASGVRANGYPVRVTPLDVWHLGSCTKAMTATLVGMFVQAGAFTWTDKISTLLPDAAVHPGYANVTIEMLLQHRGGMPEVEPDEVANDLYYANQQSEAPSITRRRAVYYMLARAPGAQVGSFTYSNAGYVAAGVVLERFFGQPWEVLMQQHLFAPLGMTSCGFGPAATPPAQLDQPWGHYAQNGMLLPQPPNLDADNPVAYGPAGTVHCSLQDWARFLNEHIRGAKGQSPLASKAIFDRLHTAAPGGEFASGWAVDTSQSWSGGLALTHSGSNTLNYVITWIAPATGVILVGASNAGTDAAGTAIDSAFHPMLSLLPN